MKIDLILERILTGKKVKFSESTIKDGIHAGNKIIIVKDLENNLKFVLGASMYNYIRFMKWIGKEAYADYEINKHKLIPTAEGKLPTVNISTEVEIEKEHYKQRHSGRAYKGEEYDI
jgi:hypothetical protein